MLSGAELAACFAVRIVVTITPGADMTQIMKRVLTHGRTAGLYTVFASLAGSSSTLCSRRSTILSCLANAFTVVELAVADCLIYLGA